MSIAAFAGAAVRAWGAGTRLSRSVDQIATLAGPGAGFVGLLLGGITSLPEQAPGVAASASGDAPLAIDNVPGSAAFNPTLLAVADAVPGRRALTAVIGHPIPLFQGVIGILLPALVVTGVTIGETAVLGVGLWSAALMLLSVFPVWLTSRYQHSRPSAAIGPVAERQETRAGGRERGKNGKRGANSAANREQSGGSLRT